VSRAYVNNVNITNTSVNITRVTNVYNTVVINKTTVNNITYVNQHVTNGVTVVSHDAFVNARPVATNIMHVDAREVASAPVGHVVAAEPVHASVIGVGRPVSARPPAAVMSRQVVAVRTPAAPPRPIEQRQAAAGGHLNQQALVRPAGPAQPAPARPQQGQPAGQGGFRPFTPAGGNSQVKVQPNAQPRTLEEQGTPPPPAARNSTPPPAQNRNQEPTNQQSYRSPEPAQPVQSHPLVRPAPAVQERNEQQEHQQEQKFNTWQQQRPASPPPAQHPAESRPEPPKQEKPKK
jgi:hypothetical protein